MSVKICRYKLSLKNFLYEMSALFFALFILIGRWTPLRLYSEDSQFAFWSEPRFWIILILIFLSLLFSTKKSVVYISYHFHIAFMFSFLFILLFSSILWSPNPKLAISKAYEILLIVSALWILILLIATVEDFTVRVWRYIFVFTLMLALFGILKILFSGTGRLAVLGGGPNVYGRLMSLLAIFSLDLIFASKKLFVKYLSSQLFFLANILLLLSGSRGAIFSNIVAICVLIIHYTRVCKHVKVKHLLLIVLILFGSMLGFFILSTLTPIINLITFIYNYRILQSTIKNLYLSGRERIYYSAIELWQKKPFFGSGLNSFEIMGYGIYPHNIFLEILVETGILGFLIFCSTILYFIFTTIKYRFNLHWPSIASVFLYFLSSQVSGDIYDSRALFLFAIMAITYNRKMKTAC